MRTLSSEQRRFFESAVSTYQEDLSTDAEAQAYLLGRGLGPQAAAGFRLGVVRRPLQGHEGYAGRLVLPYLTPAGVVSLRFRCLGQHEGACEGHPKYLSEQGAETRLYNVLDLKKASSSICIAEGELDAISLSLSGLPAVGVPGVESWQPHWGRLLDDFQTVYCLADPDKAGRKFASFLAKEAAARAIHLPTDQDVNDVFRTGGPAAVKRLIFSEPQ